MRILEIQFSSLEDELEKSTCEQCLRSEARDGEEGPAGRGGTRVVEDKAGEGIWVWVSATTSGVMSFSKVCGGVPRQLSARPKFEVLVELSGGRLDIHGTASRPLG